MACTENTLYRVHQHQFEADGVGIYDRQILILQKLLVAVEVQIGEVMTAITLKCVHLILYVLVAFYHSSDLVVLIK